MNCTAVGKLLHLYLDKALAPQEQEILEAHLAHCHQCKRELAQMERTFHLLDGLEEVSAPAGFLDEVMARVKEKALADVVAFSPGRALLSFRAQVVFYSLVALVALMGLFLVFQSGGELREALAYTIASPGEGEVYDASVQGPSSLVTFLDSLLSVAGYAEPGLILGASLLFLAGCLALVQLIRGANIPRVGAQWAG